jgi:cytochrome b pre-mRNA-processing protein 3
VGKKMRRLGEALYGRMKNYQAAFAAIPETDPLRDVLTRTVYAGAPAPQAEAMARYVIAQRAYVMAQPVEALSRGELDWRAA